jgi:hypothetical protein
MQQLQTLRPSRTLWLLVLALVAAVAVLMLQLGNSARGLISLPLHDFVEYWAAGRLNVHGENPYDLDRIQQLEREVGREEDAVLMWNPPWTLPLVMPLGLLDSRFAHLLWLAVQLAAVFWSADALWRLYGGPLTQRGVAWLLALLYLPTLFALTAGQIAPLVLLGTVLFLTRLKRGDDFLAGAALVLTAIKPHLSYLFWFTLLLWCLRERRWSLLSGGLLAGSFAVGIALACNPDVVGQYWHTLTHRPPAQYRSPTLGTILRLWFGEERFRLQFLAVLPGFLWLGFHWANHRNEWDWNECLPMLLLVSMLTAAYGAWPFDLVLLLPAVVRVAAACASGTCSARSTLLGALAFLAINAVAATQLAFEVEYFAFVWMTPALLIAYLVLLPRRVGLNS